MIMFSVTRYPRVMTFVMSKEMAATMAHDDTALRASAEFHFSWNGARDAGMIHSWRYNDGSIRFTYRPDKAPL